MITTEMKLNKLQKNALELIKKDTLTETEILKLKRRLNNRYTALGIETRDFILDNLEEKEYNITPEQSQKGIEWLNKKCFCKDGRLRKGINELFSTWRINILRDFDHFTFIGFYESNNGYVSLFTPIYRVYDKKGNSFDYTVTGMYEIDFMY